MPLHFLNYVMTKDPTIITVQILSDSGRQKDGNFWEAKKERQMEITHPQSHRRGGWSLCSWCGAHAVEDRHTGRQNKQKSAGQKYSMFIIKP